MTVKCIKCRKKIDAGHDKHYYCKNHQEVLVCTDCFLKRKKCPKCGKALQFTDDSTKKKAYFNPSTRNLLGF